MQEFATQHQSLFVCLTILLSALSVPLLFLLIYLMIRWMMASIRRQLETLQQTLGGRVVVGLWKGYYLQLMEEGIEIRIGLTPGGRSSPPTFYLQSLTPLGFNLSVSKENVITRGLNKLGALQDLKIGVPPFDDGFSIRSDDEAAAMNYLHENSRYATVEQFFQEGFSLFQGSNKVIFLSKSYYHPSDLEPDHVRMVLDQMKGLIP